MLQHIWNSTRNSSSRFNWNTVSCEIGSMMESKLHWQKTRTSFFRSGTNYSSCFNTCSYFPGFDVKNIKLQQILCNIEHKKMYAQRNWNLSFFQIFWAWTTFKHILQHLVEWSAVIIIKTRLNRIDTQKQVPEFFFVSCWEKVL